MNKPPKHLRDYYSGKKPDKQTKLTEVEISSNQKYVRGGGK